MTAPILIYMRLGWPLTGRSKEMRLIEAALSDRDCSGIVVCGAAGVGKSRIAREAMTSAASNGCEVRWVVATSSARALPLGALRSWAGPAGGDSLQLVRGVIESLTCAPNGATVVVGVDDAPLLDDLSIFVVHQIVQRGGAKVVFTVRDGEPVPAAIQEVWKEGRFDRLELQPLSRDDTDDAGVGDSGRVPGSGCRGPAVGADPRQCAVSAQHCGAGGHRGSAGAAARSFGGGSAIRWCRPAWPN